MINTGEALGPGPDSNQQRTEVGFCPYCGSSDVITYSRETKGQDGVECPECKRLCTVQAQVEPVDNFFGEDNYPEASMAGPAKDIPIPFDR